MILTLLTSEQQENSKKAEQYICQLRPKPKFTLTLVEESLHIFTDCFYYCEDCLPYHTFAISCAQDKTIMRH